MFESIQNSKKLLGMNARNLNYIRPYNLLRAKKLADNKLLSKKLLAKNGITVSSLLFKISNREELENFDWTQLPNSFALKPNRGFGGEGIVVVYGKRKGYEDTWIKADRSRITTEDLKNHIQNILDGAFSLSNTPDIAFFEERVRLSKTFKPYTFKGIPDIRVIVFNKVPVMAMLRLPTKDSKGKANLQQGAIGVGIDMASGVTTTAIQGKSKLIERIPESRLTTSGLRIPFWKDILLLAVKAQEISKLGFLGVDIAIDKEKGPLILELNARPGLSIQLANLSGLKERLERVAGLKIKTIERGVRVGRDLFGGEVEEEVEDISGRKVISITEKVKLVGKDGKEIETEAKIDTGASSSSIDIELAKQLGFEDLLNFFDSIEKPSDFTREQVKEIEEGLRNKYIGKHPDLAGITVVYSSNGKSIRPAVKITFILDNVEISAQVNIANRSELEKDMIIGRKNLGKFLIDVNKI
jgi:alpha-L-glutamate ligase-like protein